MKKRLTVLFSVPVLLALLAPYVSAGERYRFPRPQERGGEVKAPVSSERIVRQPSTRMVPSDAPVIASRRFSIEYAVKNIFGFGNDLSKVELFLTDDMGETWVKHGEDVSAKSPYVLTVKQDGVYGFALVSTDSVGNRERDPFPGMYPDRMVVVDTVPPTGKFLSPAGRAIMADSGINLVWETFDAYPGKNPVTLQYSSDQGKSWRVIESGSPLPASGSLMVRPKRQTAVSYTFRMIARDKAGNQATIEAPGIILTDNIPPSITLTGPREPRGKTVELTYNVSDNAGGSGVAAVVLWTTADGGATWIPYGRAAQVNNLFLYENRGEAKVGFALQAEDVAGNMSKAPASGDAPALVHVFDTVGPEVSLSVGGGERQFRGGDSVSIEWKALDASPNPEGVTVEFSADGGKTWEMLVEKQPAESGYRWLLARDNEKNLPECLIQITAVDGLGNVTVKQSATFKILNIAPATDIKIVAPAQRSTVTEEGGADIDRDIPPFIPVAPAGMKRHPNEGMVTGDELEVIGTKAYQTEQADRENLERRKSTPRAEENPDSRQAEENRARLTAIAKEAAEEAAAKEKRAKVAEEPVVLVDQKAEAIRKLRIEARRVQDELDAKLAESESNEKEEAANAQREEKERAVAAARLMQQERDQKKAEAEAFDRAQKREEAMRLEAERKKSAETPSIAKVKDTSATGITTARVQGDSNELVKQGELAFEEDRGKQAELFAIEALERDPNTFGAHLLLAKIQGSRGVYPEALASAEKAIVINDKNPDSYMVMGNLSFEMVKQTQKRLDTLMEVQGDQVDIDRTREALEKHYRNSVAALRQVTKLDKSSKEAFGRLGDVFYYRGKGASDDAIRQSAYWDALEAFKAASEIGTIVYKEAFHLGVIHFRRNEVDPAIRYFQRGIEVCPADRKPRECLWYLSEAYEKQGRLDDALLFWKKTAQAYDPANPAEADYNRKATQNARNLELKLNN